MSNFTDSLLILSSLSSSSLASQLSILMQLALFNDNLFNLFCSFTILFKFILLLWTVSSIIFLSSLFKLPFKYLLPFSTYFTDFLKFFIGSTSFSSSTSPISLSSFSSTSSSSSSSSLSFFLSTLNLFNSDNNWILLRSAFSVLSWAFSPVSFLLSCSTFSISFFNWFISFSSSSLIVFNLSSSPSSFFFNILKNILFAWPLSFFKPNLSIKNPAKLAFSSSSSLSSSSTSCIISFSSTFLLGFIFFWGFFSVLFINLSKTICVSISISPPNFCLTWSNIFEIKSSFILLKFLSTSLTLLLLDFTDFAPWLLTLFLGFHIMVLLFNLNKFFFGGIFFSTKNGFAIFSIIPSFLKGTKGFWEILFNLKFLFVCIIVSLCFLHDLRVVFLSVKSTSSSSSPLSSFFSISFFIYFSGVWTIALSNPVHFELLFPNNCVLLIFSFSSSVFESFIKSSSKIFLSGFISKLSFINWFLVKKNSILLIPSSSLLKFKHCNFFPYSPNKNPSPIGVPKHFIVPDTHLNPKNVI